MVQKLVLVRHGQSEWNLKNLFTGWKNPNLTPKGIEEAKIAGNLLLKKNIKINLAFTSALIRAKNTCDYMLETMQQNPPIIENKALNERDYGDLAGLNKDEARVKWGAEQIQIWRRSYEIAPPGGESLKDTAARVLPYYIYNILPNLLEQKNILIVAHGNSLRALIMAIEGISGEEIIKKELQTGKPIIYDIAKNSKIINKIEL